MKDRSEVIVDTFKYDMHVHTSEVSMCGKVPAVEAVRLYREAGYRGIVVTDHYAAGFFRSLGLRSWEDKVEAYLKGYRIARSEGEKVGLAVLLGIELCFVEDGNDYLVYGVDEAFLKEHKKLYRLNPAEFRKLTAGRNILVYQAHPFRPRITPADPALLDGVEVWNGNPRQESNNDKALAFARAHKLKMISGSDFHQPGDLARGGVLLPKAVETPAELVEILKKDEVAGLISALLPRLPSSGLPLP